MSLKNTVIAVIIVILVSLPCGQAVSISAQKIDNNISSATTSNKTVHPWPTFHHGINRTGQSEYDTSKNNGKQKWGYNIGMTSNFTSQPVIDSNGTIYVGSSNQKLYAIYPNGTKKWDFQTVGGYGVWPPSISRDGIIYFGSEDHYLYSLNNNGTLRWKVYAGDGVMFSTSPAIVYNKTWSKGSNNGTYMIYIASHIGELYAITPNGTVMWKHTGPGTSTYSSPSVGNNGTIYYSSHYSLLAINPNGTVKWNRSGIHASSSACIGNNGTLYWSMDYMSPCLLALYPNGTIKWNMTISSTYSTAAIDNNNTIYLGVEQYLLAINPNGTIKWKLPTPHPPMAVGSSPAIGADGTIFYGGYKKLYTVFPNGTVKWEFLTNDWVGSPAIGADGTIYIGTLDGKLYAIGTQSAPEPVFTIIFITIPLIAIFYFVLRKNR